MLIDQLNKLNQHQTAAVLDNSDTCLVKAIVGSGKTTALITKIQYLHIAKGIPYGNMIVLTFSNKAAEEIKSRLGNDADEISFIGTYHSVASNLLRTVLPIESLGYNKDFSVIPPEEVEELVQSLITDRNLNIKYRNAVIKRLADAARGLFLKGNMKRIDDIAELLESFRSEKKIQNKLDFDDLIRFATFLLPQSEFKAEYIIVDEFQDTNPEQYAMLKAMKKLNTKLFAVGDPSQQIYGFNGSRNDIFEKLNQDYKPTVLTLPVNYRSTSTILKASEPFKTDEATDLIPAKGSGDVITVKRHYDASSEANYIATRIQELVNNGLKYSDFAIFYRLQKQSASLVNALSKLGIPYRISEKKTLKEIPVLDWAFRVLKVAVNTRDRSNAIAMLTSEDYGEGLSIASAKEAIKRRHSTGNSSKVELLDKAMNFKAWSEGKNATDLDGYFRFEDCLYPNMATYEDDKKNLSRFMEYLREYITSKKLQVFEGVSRFLGNATLEGMGLFNDNTQSSEDTVNLMTLHACKGTQFKYVFIIGLNNGLVPLISSSDNPDEERRVFYVGMTRAEQHLELSYYSVSPERGVAPGKSEYLHQLPAECIEEIDPKIITTDLNSLQNRFRARRYYQHTAY